MGALGEMYALHAYIGPESFETFRKIQADQIMGAQEFYASQHSVYVEFVTVGKMEKQDRELLAALGYPEKRAVKYPIFRAIRNGYYPWFVTAEEAQVLSECIHAVSVVCSTLAAGSGSSFWDQKKDLYPLIALASSGETDYRIEQAKVITSWTAPLPKPACVDETLLRRFGRSARCRPSRKPLPH